MNNRVCLHPDIKWHGTPKVFKVKGFGVAEVDGALIATVNVTLKRMGLKINCSQKPKLMQSVCCGIP